MKALKVKLQNPLNTEEWICEDYNSLTHIDGVEYIRVHKPAETRSFLMRKEALKVIKKLTNDINSR
jgi:hypothetical protein